MTGANGSVTMAAVSRSRILFPALVALLAISEACASGAVGGRVVDQVAGGVTPNGFPQQAVEDNLVPPGHGTLHQDEITLSLRSDALLIKVTPLAEGVIRLTAPDTYDRLAGLARTYRESAARRAPVRDPLLVLVSFFSYEPNVTFQPEDLHIRSHGIRYRPLAVLPVTPGWGTQRLNQQETQIGVYAFDPRVDLRSPLFVEYRQVQSPDWERVLPKLDEERAKVRARASPPVPRSLSE